MEKKKIIGMAVPEELYNLIVDKAKTRGLAIGTYCRTILMKELEQELGLQNNDTKL